MNAVGVCALVVLALCGHVESLTAGQPNVCQKIVTKLTTVVQATQLPYQRCTKTWCKNIWDSFRCTHCYALSRLLYKQVSATQYVTEYHCCDGYIQSGDQCVSYCQNGCVQGTCVGPNDCVCHPGWRGINCSSSFTGEKCQTQCLHGTYGPKCQFTCQCQNGATCDPGNGLCYCAVGFHGPICELTCKSQGEHCSDVHKFQNNASYVTQTGACSCTEGRMGSICTEPCMEGTYGRNCQQTCRCYNNATCDRENGYCTCKPGYLGSQLVKEKTMTYVRRNVLLVDGDSTALVM